ncbi:ribonuclease P protein component [Terriglobus sp.]|uniref:ribonuclease P protein component n=1 Tax=Terriglobus sp. TaxID=1889013 RepID=UPI003B00E7FA
MTETRLIPDPVSSSRAALSSAAELRLRRHAEFQRVYNATKKQHGKQMSFFAAGRVVLPGEYAGPRVGLTVGKVMGKAHVRNRIKRRLREAVRAEQGALRGLAVDVVLHPRRTVETLPFLELRAELAGVFRRIAKAR